MALRHTRELLDSTDDAAGKALTVASGLPVVTLSLDAMETAAKAAARAPERLERVADRIGDWLDDWF